MNKLSVKWRITIWYTLLMTVMSAVLLGLTLSVTRGMMERDLTGRVTKSVGELAHRLSGPPLPNHSGRAQATQYFEQGVHMALYNSEGEQIAGHIPFDVGDVPDFQDDTLRKSLYDGELCFVYDKAVHTHDGETLWLKGIVSFSGEAYMLRAAAKTNTLLTLALILAAAIGGYCIIRHALKPVDAISKTAHEISESRDLSRRIALNGSDEIHRMAAAFDGMLDKIEATLEREKQFTSDASHELRTPVAVIISECEYALDCAKTVDEYQESAQSVMRQAEKMSNLINELLTVSRMDRNTQAVNFEILDVGELLTFVCEEQQKIHCEAIKLYTEICDGLFVKADRFLLARLFINLIANAYQYTPAGGNIYVSVAQEDARVCITVRDTGIGIAAEELPKIWERFYQVDPSRSNRTGSSGLGLSIVKWITDAHNGTISVESEPDKGTSFTLRLPLSNQEPN